MTQERKDFTAENKNELKTLSPLQKNTLEAFQYLIKPGRFEKNSELWERFRFTYEHRRTRPWLRESENVPGISLSGLAHALSEGFWNFPDTTSEWLHKRNLEKRMKKGIDDEFMERVSNAAEELVTNKKYISDFEYKLGIYGINAENVRASTLCVLIKNGLDVYWEQTYAHGGLSSDPW